MDTNLNPLSSAVINRQLFDDHNTFIILGIGSNLKLSLASSFVRTEGDEGQALQSRVVQIELEDTKGQGGADKKKEIPKEFSLSDRNFRMRLNLIFQMFCIEMTWMTILIQKHVLGKGISLEPKHIPELQHSEKVENQYKVLEEVLEKLVKGERIQGKHILKMVQVVYSRSFMLCHICIVLYFICKQFTSIIIQQLIQSYSNDGPNSALKWAFVLLFVFVLNAVLNSKSFNIAKNLSAQIRLALVTFLYTKASKLTNHQIQKANIGKLFNLISYDLNTLESMVYFLLLVFYVPLLLVVAAVIIYQRIGGYGLLGILIVTLIIPIQFGLGLASKKYLNFKNKQSDERIKLVNESVDGVRLMKMYGWEEAFIDYVSEVRKKEIKSISSVQYFRSSDRASSIAFSLIAGFVPILLMYESDVHPLNTAVIYSTLEQLFGLKSTLFLAGIGVGFFFELGLILNRFGEFMMFKNESMIALKKNPSFDDILFERQKEIKNKQKQLNEKKLKDLVMNQGKILKESDYQLNSEELEILSKDNQRLHRIDQTVEVPKEENNLVELEGFHSYWDIDAEPVLKDINLKIKKGQHYGIVGKTGSGKSTLLSVILGEIPFYEGELRKTGTVSYVEQEPYIFSGKLKDNILFGKPFEEQFYSEVISACCLKEDLQQLANGDQTEIGEKGVTLSGGQKARLSLARAVYSRNDIYLLDDPLSAVDSKVAKRLYQFLLKGLLKGKTVILVTHQVLFTRSCDEILILNDGRVLSRGKFAEIQSHLLEMVNQQSFEDESMLSPVRQISLKMVRKLSILRLESQKQIARQQSKPNIPEIKTEKAKLVAPDSEEKIQITNQTYSKYMNYMGGWPFILGELLLYLICELIYTGYYYMLGSYDSSDDKERLFIVAGIMLICFIVICYFKYGVTICLSSRANQRIHKEMFQSISRAPVSYFDRMPSGRILSRFSTDLGSVDMMLPYLLFDCMELFFQFLNIFVTVSYMNPWIIIPFSVLIGCSLMYLKWSKQIIIQSKQLDQASKSPVYSLFSKTIQGIIHIRIYDQLDRFHQEMFKKANDSIRTNFLFWNVSRAFSFNLQMLTIFISFLGILMCLYSSLTPNFLGQSIVYLIMLIDITYSLLRQIPNFDGNMTSVARMQQICDIKQEDALVLPTDKSIIQEQAIISKTNNTKEEVQQFKQDKWIVRGEIEFREVSMRYREGLDFVLKRTSVKIKGGERVGCVGRTGAGKSSILQTLFRMTEIEKDGGIYIDGIDIRSIGLHTLRKAMSIIPQAPFVFTGSIRRNLDPLSEYSDEKIWEVLESTSLLEIVKGFPKGIQTEMTQSTFSTGQKQLICLARAILKKSKILVLDEATANVDMQTDTLIQNTIKMQFQDSTIFTIAHRLNTIADYDKIIVMDDGKVAEFNDPFSLLAENVDDFEITSNSIFSQMVKYTGKDNAQSIFNIAQLCYFEKYPHKIQE